jgi:hypothetical protein
MGHSFQPSVFTCMILKLLVLKQRLKYTISCGISFLGPWVNVFFIVKIEEQCDISKFFLIEVKHIVHMHNVDIVWVCHYIWRRKNASKLFNFLSSFNKVIHWMTFTVWIIEAKFIKTSILTGKLKINNFLLSESKEITRN